MLTITTTYRTDARGAGKVTAKGAGKQYTMPWDHSKSKGWNHGTAAALLLMERLGWPTMSVEKFDSLGITYMGFNDGTHKFNVPT